MPTRQAMAQPLTQKQIQLSLFIRLVHFRIGIWVDTANASGVFGVDTIKLQNQPYSTIIWINSHYLNGCKKAPIFEKAALVTSLNLDNSIDRPSYFTHKNPKQ
jgi:hypothetical protein